ncbi:MAG: haloacid dehalogenase type II [Acidobacteria bacterium]|nr:haloacid dehalogenase type II [Acidobacteriota bacterium]MCA1612370.1 haloacid dehalogenase type II [Acidobacteriota bacterium]
MRAFDLVAFDLYGTLLDVAGLANGMRPITGEQSPALLGRWRQAQLERSWRLNREDAYEPWDLVTLRALEEIAPELPAESRERLADLWLTVPAFADARETLQALKSAGVRRAVLSNGTRPMIARALETAGLDVETILSADDVRAYKTDPRAYALLDTEADPARTLFVSSNGWDADGARRTGRTVVWIDRGGAPPTAPPSYRVASLTEITPIVMDAGTAI